MLPDLQDTIVALSSPPGAGRRGIVRISGPGAWRHIAPILELAEPIDPAERIVRQRFVRLPGVQALLPVDLYYWPGPGTYTGQDLIELHTIGSPPLLDVLIAQLLHAGCRAAGPGEFTLRAFLAGKLDLPKAEAVLGIIEAGDAAELKNALTQLAGGLTSPLHGLREDLLNLLADVEAGLDFADEDIRFVDQSELLNRLARGLAQVILVQKQIQQRAVSERPFRIVLAGRPNVGKSSLFNALAGAVALVADTPGTTRDYLIRRIQLADVSADLVDTAGWQELTNLIEEQAHHLGREQTRQADLLLWCVPAGSALDKEERRLLAGVGSTAVQLVATKCDLAGPLTGFLATSSQSGAGLDDLRAFLIEQIQARRQPPLAPSLSRCRHHVETCLEHLRRAHAVVLYEDPAEILALELRDALEHLGAMVGAVYTDDLLDRIFSRFCIGK